MNGHICVRAEPHDSPHILIGFCLDWRVRLFVLIRRLNQLIQTSRFLSPLCWHSPIFHFVYNNSIWVHVRWMHYNCFNRRARRLSRCLTHYGSQKLITLKTFSRWALFLLNFFATDCGRDCDGRKSGRIEIDITFSLCFKVCDLWALI